MEKGRFFFFLGILLLAFTGILGRFFYWQVIAGERLDQIAQKQRFKIMEIPAPRGKIYSSDNSLLVFNQPSYSVYIYLPNTNMETEQIAKKIAPVLAEDEMVKNKTEDLLTSLNSGKNWLVIAKSVGQETKNKIDTLKIDGLHFEQENIRNYSEASMSAHMLGFVGLNDAGKRIGYFGLEGFYNQQLAGISGLIVEEKGINGQIIASGREIKQEANNGLNLNLYLDRVAQFIMEEELKKGMVRFGAKQAWGVMLEPKTGGIIAMASFPNYDPAEYGQYEESLFSNPIVAQGFEPGSIFKPLVMAAAIEKKVVSPETKCPNCDGPKKIGDHEIKTWNNKYYPDSTMSEVIINSDNVGMIFVAERLGVSQMIAYLEKYGFDEKTKVDLQEEAYFKIRNKKQWYPIDLASASFGQGILITPIQMTRAFASLANGGFLIQPQAVKEIWSETKGVAVANHKSSKKILSQETTEKIKQMLIAAVDEGEAKRMKPQGLSIAGKTGTAQIAIDGKYDPEKTIASFIGFAPADEPKFVMLVSYKEPSSSPWGSETAAPTWFAITKRLAYYWNLL